MQTTHPSRFLTRRRLLALGLAAILAAGIWYWRLPAPLTAEEQQLVGVWTFPMGPPPVPTNAIQQIFELRSNHTLVTCGRRVSDGSYTTRSHGTWRLDGNTLVFERQNSNDWRQLAVSLDGGRRPERTRTDRMPYLGADADTIHIEANNGSEATFLRLDDSEETSQ